MWGNLFWMGSAIFSVFGNSMGGFTHAVSPLMAEDVACWGVGSARVIPMPSDMISLGIRYSIFIVFLWGFGAKKRGGVTFMLDLSDISSIFSV